MGRVNRRLECGWGRNSGAVWGKEPEDFLNLGTLNSESVSIGLP